MSNALLGVNIDHIATIRNARGHNISYPDPVQAAFIAEQAGADSITIHLREDRRHIKDRDIYILKETIQTNLNFEMAITNEMIKIACLLKPNLCCLVPENRNEITTEGGLDVISQFKKLKDVIQKLQDSNILVSLFIDPDEKQIDASIDLGANYIEIHTGFYSNFKSILKRNIELSRISTSASYAKIHGLKVNAGHGLNYHNIIPIASLKEIYEINIGHSIISRAVINGLSDAVKEMKKLIKSAKIL